MLGLGLVCDGNKAENTELICGSIFPPRLRRKMFIETALILIDQETISGPVEVVQNVNT